MSGNLTVEVEDGLSVTSEGLNTGILVSSSNGSVVISGAGADVASEDAGAIGAFAAGDLTVAIDDVTTSGLGAWGVTTFTFSGDTVIEADTVTTGGDYGLGIVADSAIGNIRISANEVDTSGFASDGITVRTGGDIEVDVGSIEGEGDFVWGINATNGAYVDGQIITGETRIDVGSIEITGDYASGVTLVTYGGADIKVGELTISGDNGNGIRAAGIDDVSVEVGNATFTGQYTGGILAFSYGEASVKVGDLTSENGGGVVAFGVLGARAEANKITVEGDFANGIQSVSQDGGAFLKVGEVSTNGFFAVAVNGDALKGDLNIEAGKITTQGELAMGIRAFGRTSNIKVSGPLSTDGDVAFGILNSTTHGDAIVRTSGTVSTTGTYADALWITGRYGTADINTVGKVSTTGDDSRAIHAIGEDGQVKIVANEVETSGDGSDGIRARTRFVEIFLGQPSVPEPVDFTGDIDIVAETVKVTGAGSTGISARGLGKATIDAGTVSALDSYAIETDMIEDSAIRVRKSATSTQGTAILAAGGDVAITVDSGATVAGGEHGIVVKAMGDRCIMRNPIDGSPNPCPNPGDDLTPHPPNETGDGGLATITNAGTIQGGSGYAVEVERGTLTLNNSGTIVGAVLLGDGDDVINNSGTFTVGAHSDFGAGTDLFKNSGAVTFATSTTPKAHAFLNLERFENSGTIDLRNEVVGDGFTLSGAYVGSGDATVGLDVNFANGTADKLIVQGAATGTTGIALGVAADAARLTSAGGIALVDVGAGSAADAFIIAEESRDIGFIRYGLTFDATARRYLLQGVAGSGAYRQLNALEGAENAWHASADVWRSNDAANRDAAWAGLDTSDTARGRLWGQVYGDRTSRDAEAEEAGVGGNQAIDFRYEQNLFGAQLGYDIGGSQGDEGGFRFGVTGGYAKSSLDSRAADEETRFETLNIGAYAAFSSGPLWGSLLAKYDRHKVKFDSAALEFDEDVDGSTWGIEAEAGTRLGDGDFFVEPVASLAWTQTDLDQLEALGQVLDFDQSDGLRGKIGARVGGRSELGNGDLLLFYGSAKAVRDFGKKYRLTLVSGNEQEEISADRVGTFGEGVIGISYLTRGGFEGFLEGQGELGSEYESFGGRAGLRLRI